MVGYVNFKYSQVNPPLLPCLSALHSILHRISFIWIPIKKRKFSTFCAKILFIAFLVFVALWQTASPSASDYLLWVPRLKNVLHFLS